MPSIRLYPLLLASGWLLAGTPDSSAQTTNPPSGKASGPTLVMGSPTDPDRFSNLPRLLLDDAGHVVTGPARWDRPDWVTAGVSVAAVVGTALLLDRPTTEAVGRNANGSWDRGAKAVEKLGGTPSVLIAGGTYLAGIAFKDPEVRATGIDTMVTMGVAQLLIVLPLKAVVGRSRPIEDQGTHDFHPLRRGQSFPSGHTTQAFALAAVISEHADRPWVTGLSYGLAGLVGVARVEQRQHFVSDVVAGGLIGTFVGKAVVAHNQALRADARSKLSVSFTPLVAPGSYGISVAMTF
ncbi:MAG TPA: phosphatase PAP2 family protein [Geothrix sp.]